MERFSTEQRTKVVQLYFESQHSIVQTQRLYRAFARFNGSRFFSWGYLKGKVYANKPRTIQELKTNMREEVRALGPEIRRKVMENALERAREVEANSGRHLKDIIFKT